MITNEVNKEKVITKVESLNTRKLKLDTQKLVDLPVASPLLGGILNSLGDEEMTIREFAALVRQDPVLSARFIGLANSAYFGHSESITSVEDAIFKSLGFQLAKSMALGIVMAGSFNKSIHCPGFSVNNFWLEAVLCANLARDLSVHMKTVPRPSSDDAYLSGLLHDFGYLPLVYLYSTELQSIFLEHKNVIERQTAMRESLGTDHHQVGEWVTRNWQIPENIVAVLGHYPDGEYEGDHQVLVRLLHGVVGIIQRYLLEDEQSLETPEVIYLVDNLNIDLLRMDGALQSMYRKRDAVESIAQELAKGT